jgi:hypothetical protein
MPDTKAPAYATLSLFPEKNKNILLINYITNFLLHYAGDVWPFVHNWLPGVQHG